MTLTKYALNGVSGTVATAANTGATTFSESGLTPTLSSGAAANGSATGLRTVGNGSNAGVAVWSYATANLQGAISFVWRVPTSGTPASSQNFWSLYDNGGTAARIADLVVYQNNGAISLIDKGNTVSVILTSAQVTANAGQQLRFELVHTVGTTTSNGAFTIRAYNSAGTQIGSTATSAVANLGVNPALKLYSWTPSSYTGNNDVDSIQMDDGRNTEIGVITSNTTPPVLTMGANQTVNASQSVNVTVSAAPQGGDSVASYAWTVLDAFTNTGSSQAFPAITNASAATASFTTSATPGRYTLQVVVTDTSGNQSVGTTRVFVPSLNGAPIEVTSNSGWTGTIAGVVDASDATYYESGSPGSNNVLVLRLSPLVAATSGWTLNVHDLVQAFGGTQRVELLEGATVRKNWGAIGPGTSFADQLLTLSTAEMATIGSWNELDLRFTQV